MEASPEVRVEPVDVLPSGAHLYRGVEEGRTLSFRAALQRMLDSAPFRASLTDAVLKLDVEAVRFEAPVLRSATLDRPFEFLLLESPELARPADPSSFMDHLRDTPFGELEIFSNLRGDAVLVAPWVDRPSDFGHLAAFLRSAPSPHAESVWAAVARATLARLDQGRTVWLNTAGAAVPWLHFRLDSRPKYYRGRWFEDEQP